MTTVLQRKCLDYIAGRIHADGVGPSVREIRDALRLNSMGSVSRLLVELERRKKIRRLWHRSRAIELTPSAKSEYGFVPLVAYPEAKYFRADRVGERTVLTEIQWTCTIPPKPDTSSTLPSKG